MNDVQSTIVGLKAQECPGGGWIGMPADMKATVSDCLANGVCGCIYGNAVQHIEALCAEIDRLRALNIKQCENIAFLDAEIERLNYAFSDCAENAEAWKATAERLQTQNGELRVALMALVTEMDSDCESLGSTFAAQQARALVHEQKADKP